MVSDQDAANLADALEMLLHDLSNKSLNKYVKIGGLTMAYKEDNIEPMKHFSGRFYKKIIKDFIHFCRQGKFVIR